jgi:hypothetical protein
VSIPAAPIKPPIAQTTVAFASLGIKPIQVLASVKQLSKARHVILLQQRPAIPPSLVIAIRSLRRLATAPNHPVL